jgi:hypothetical protein
MNAARPPSPDVLLTMLSEFRAETNDKLDRLRLETNDKLDRLDRDVSRNYVTRAEWALVVAQLAPLRTAVFGFIGVVLLAFMGLLIYKVGWTK